MKPEIIIEHDVQPRYLTQMRLSIRPCTKLSHVWGTSLSSRCLDGTKRFCKASFLSCQRSGDVQLSNESTIRLLGYKHFICGCSSSHMAGLLRTFVRTLAPSKFLGREMQLKRW